MKSFESPFEEPKSLPLHRKHDLCVPLEKGVKWRSLRRYIHSSTQKDVIEEMIREIIQGGII